MSKSPNLIICEALISIRDFSDGARHAAPSESKQAFYLIEQKINEIIRTLSESSLEECSYIGDEHE